MRERKMKFCTRCGTQNEDGNAVCTSCGTPFAVYTGAPTMQVNPYDHTAEMDPKAISENKVVAMLPYLIGWVGIILCALLSANSKFASFHVREALKLTVCKILVVIVGVVLFWTFIVPLLAGLLYFVLWVVGIIGFFNVCRGKAVSLPVVKGLGFLK